MTDQWVKLHAEVLRRRMSDRAVAVYAALALCARRDGVVTHTRAEITERLGRSMAWLERGLRELRNDELVTVTRTAGAAYITLPLLAGPSVKSDGTGRQTVKSDGSKPSNLTGQTVKSDGTHLYISRRVGEKSAAAQDTEQWDTQRFHNLSWGAQQDYLRRLGPPPGWVDGLEGIGLYDALKDCCAAGADDAWVRAWFRFKKREAGL